MLKEGRLKLGEQLLRHVSGMSPLLQPGNEFPLTGHMMLALGDVSVHHFDIGGIECHDQIYHDLDLLSCPFELWQSWHRLARKLSHWSCSYQRSNILVNTKDRAFNLDYSCVSA